MLTFYIKHFCDIFPAHLYCLLNKQKLVPVKQIPQAQSRCVWRMRIRFQAVLCERDIPCTGRRTPGHGWRRERWRVALWWFLQPPAVGSSRSPEGLWRSPEIPQPEDQQHKHTGFHSASSTIMFLHVGSVNKGGKHVCTDHLKQVCYYCKYVLINWKKWKNKNDKREVMWYSHCKRTMLQAGPWEWLCYCHSL